MLADGEVVFRRGEAQRLKQALLRQERRSPRRLSGEEQCDGLEIPTEQQPSADRGEIRIRKPATRGGFPLHTGIAQAETDLANLFQDRRRQRSA